MRRFSIWLSLLALASCGAEETDMLVETPIRTFAPETADRVTYQLSCAADDTVGSASEGELELAGREDGLNVWETRALTSANAMCTVDLSASEGTGRPLCTTTQTLALSGSPEFLFLECTGVLLGASVPAGRSGGT